MDRHHFVSSTASDIEAAMVKSERLTDRVVSEVSSMGTSNPRRTERLQTTLHDGRTITSGALKSLTNDLQNPLGYIVVHHDSTALMDRVPEIPTTHGGEQDKTATEYEDLNSDAEGDRGSATMSADRVSSRLGGSKLTPSLDPPLTSSASSAKNLPKYQCSPMVPAIPRIFERTQGPQSCIIGEGLRVSDDPMRGREYERSTEQICVLAVEKASYAATKATKASQKPSSVDQEDSQPLSCSSSSSAPVTDLGHKHTSSCAVENSQASSSKRNWSMPAEAIGHRKSSSVDTGKLHPRELDSPRMPTKSLRHRKSFSPLAPEFRPSRNSSVPSTPSNLGLPVHSRQPSGASREPTHLDIPASDAVKGARYQQHGHPIPTYHSPRRPQPRHGATTQPMFQNALALAELSRRPLSPALNMHNGQPHLAPWQITSRIENAYLVEQNDNNSEYTQPNPFDSYATSTPAAPTPNPSDVQTNAGLYAADTNGFQPAYFTNSNSSNQIV